jgi:hypothetical protein
MHLAHTRDCSQRCGYRSTDQIKLTLCRVAKLDVNGDMVAIQGDIFSGFSANEIFAGIGVNHTRQCGLNRVNRHAHCFSSLQSRQSKPIVVSMLA